MRKSVLLLAALALVACSGSAFAADADRGKEFARRVCALCHVVMEGQIRATRMRHRFKRLRRADNFVKKEWRYWKKIMRNCRI